MRTHRIGLILEGGGVRGIYTAGVLDVFLEQNVTVDGVIGVSAGAIHGCSYLSGQKGRSIRYYKKYCGDPRFMGFRTWLRTGDIVGADFCYHELPDKLDVFDHEAFEKNPTLFYVTCSNVETGKAEHLQITDMRKEIDLLRASASLPYFSRIVPFNGKKYLDGGCTDSIPVEAFQKMGFPKNIVILTRNVEYRKKPELSWLAKLFYRRYPAFVKALCNRHEAYNATVEKILNLEAAGDLFVIRPTESLDIGRMENNPEKIQSIYDLGRADGKKYLSDLQKWMESQL